MANSGAAEINSRRRKDWVLLRSYVFGKEGTKDEVPKRVDIQKASFDFVGSNASKKYLSGVYGTNSGDAGGYLATTWARENDLTIYFLDVWAEIPNFHSSRAQMTRAILAESHWLHIDRMSVELRDEVKDKMLTWLKRKYGTERSKAAEDMTCPQIMLANPDFAYKLLDDDPEIGMLVHPVYTKYDSKSEKPLSLWAATIHRERINIRGAEVRYMPDVECTI